MGLKQLVITAFIMVLIQAWCCEGCLEDERLALLQLQHHFSFSWFPLDTRSNCCDWRGIECDNHTGRVSHLYLSYSRDSNLGDLYFNVSLLLPFKQLSFLDLSMNNIAGFLQNEDYNNLGNDILSSLSGLLTLNKSLNISDNMQIGSIFFEGFNNLKNLKELNLRGNRLRGPFNMTKLAVLGSLELLDLSYNNISEFVASKDATIPTTNLKKIHLDEMTTKNMSLLLTSLPAHFSHLKALSLQGNTLTDSTFSYGLCILNHLQYLDLSGNYFNGELSLCLANLTSLQTLVLSYISLNGSLHSLPLNLLTHLRYLDLSENYFNGTFPLWLANLTSLQNLDLSSNLLVGNLSSSSLSSINSIQYLNLDHNNLQIPISLVPFYNWSNLSYLSISGNKLYGEIERHNLIPKFQLEELYMSGDGRGESFPKFLYNQHKLRGFDMSDNKMRGDFPHWLLENNTRLEVFHLSNNSLMGTIKLPSYSHMQLRLLDISGNSLSGKLPEKLGSYFPRSEYLDMSNNHLFGTIQDCLSNCTWLFVLDFNNNHLSGEIPSWLGRMAYLEILDLSGNNISGNIPTFWRSSLLREVYMSKNKLHGSFLYSFLNCSQLTTLDLSHNLLTEDLVRWNLAHLMLRFLLLGYNMLEGEIPRKICSLEELSFIDLSNNNLSGQIPSCLMFVKPYGRGGRPQQPLEINTQNISSEQPHRTLEITTKSNSLSYKGMILALYSGIDLSHNNLSGQIPPEFGNLSQIKTLNLSHNRLTGLIPATFSNLDQIESLDLSYNKLQGNIPPQFNQLPFISSFCVAHNNLSGRTPEMIKQFGTFDNGSYEGNPFLCGEPLSRSCTPKAPSAMSGPTPSEEEESGFIDMGILYVSFGVTYTIVVLGIAAILYINPYWRRAWFYFVERTMDDCYYFVVYDCPRFFKFKA